MPSFPNVSVVGMHFRGREAVTTAASLPLGTSLRLEREPENSHDYNAVQVFFEDQFLGYLERGQSAWIAPHMDAGEPGAFSAVCMAKQLRGKNTHPIVLVSDDLPLGQELFDAIIEANSFGDMLPFEESEITIP